jgi:hypothetical protein
MDIKKVIKQKKGIRLLELSVPVLGGKYAVDTFSSYKDGLCLDAANELFNILVKLQK